MIRRKDTNYGKRLALFTIKMDEAIETIIYKGCEIKILQDENTMSPDEWEDENVFLTGYHKDFSVESDVVSKKECQALFTDEPEDYDVEPERIKELKKQFWAFGLEAYIHSGVSLALSYEGNFVDRQWDVSQLGVVFVAKTEAKTRTEAKKIAKGLIDKWNDYLMGNIYGYIIKDLDERFDENNNLDSCWGFYGDWEESGIIDDAKGIIDYYLNETKPKMIKELNRTKKDNSKLTLGELTCSNNQSIRRNAIGILKQLQKNNA